MCEDSSSIEVMNHVCHAGREHASSAGVARNACGLTDRRAMPNSCSAAASTLTAAQSWTAAAKRCGAASQCC
jgi:hypothetical protein